MAVRTTFEEVGPGVRQRYRLLRKLATGGMAEVHLAQCSGMADFERLVVIKRIRPDLAGDPEFVRMFLQEVRIAAQLHHTNIVQIFDVDVDAEEGGVFCAMEFLHGQNLSAVICREGETGRSVPLPAALAIATRVCAGLDYAHRRCDAQGRPLGIVHRDVTPQNVFVDYDGGVKIIDFGIARAANSIGETRAGVLKGKPGYISPEQCRCEPLDSRSDLFSVGVLLYQLTVGVLPWRAETEWEYLKETTEGRPIPPRHVRPDYPEELERVVLTALAASADDRFASAGLMLDELDGFARRQGMDLSQTALSRYMASTFPGELEAWRVDEQAGLSLPQHLTRRFGLPEHHEEKASATPGERRGGSRRLLLAAGALALGVGLLMAALSMRGAPKAVGEGAAAAVRSQPGPVAAGSVTAPVPPPPAPVQPHLAVEAAPMLVTVAAKPTKTAVAAWRSSRPRPPKHSHQQAGARAPASELERLDLESMLPH